MITENQKRTHASAAFLMCNHKRFNSFGPCGFQHFLYFAHGCASGAHIVNNDDMFSAHIFWFRNYKTIFNIIES